MDGSVGRERFLEGLGEPRVARGRSAPPATPEVERPRLWVKRHASEQIQLRIPADLTLRLSAFSAQRNTPLAVTLMIGLAALLGRWCGQDEWVIDTRMVARRDPRGEPPAGVFQDTALLRIRLRQDQTVEQLLLQIEIAEMDAFARLNFPNGAGTPGSRP